MKTRWLEKYLLIGLLGLASCHGDNHKAPEAFEILDHARTGLDFSNTLHPTQEFNMFKYMYYYNGGGIGAGDFNNDGKIDLFFSANQGDNQLYLNKGNLSFSNVTKEARIPNDGEWSTGVSVVDINNDGLLDIYVCRVGNYETLHGHNQLLVCQGIDKNGVPVYKDEAKEYGVDFSGFSTQAVFFDYDMDGDLDLFLLNHSVHQNGSFAPRSNFLGTYNELSGDRLYRNDNGHFTDVTKVSGINSSAISYGLGVVVSDFNMDGYPDLYVGNDFHENDYLYINQKNGTFKDELNEHIMHTSQFSMGVDVADVNNDGYPEIISMDMLPSDPYILKRSLGEDDYDIFKYKISAGYNYQYTRNNLQLNRRNGMFSEIGLYSGIAATDWSWAPLWMDFDNDGLKDLFISNGIPKRMNDIDYVNFVSNREIQHKISGGKMDQKDMALVNKFPEIKIPNKLYKNNGNLQFVDLRQQVGNDQPTYSNGAVYADLDNDGDLDIVVNNIDQPVLLYENKSNDVKKKAYAVLKLKGPEKNINAVGAKAVLFTRDGIRTYEKSPVHGFQSSMEIPIHIGLDHTTVDSAFLIWPDHTCQPLRLDTTGKTMQLAYTKGLPLFHDDIITKHEKNPTKPMEDITASVGLNYHHVENPFVEFDREPLMPHMVSTEGPALAVADINHDGLDDVFIGGAKNGKKALFLQKPDGKFQRQPEPALDADSVYEDVDASWIDINKDGHPDLVVASGGNEFYGTDAHLLPRVYLNDGKGKLTRLENAFTDVYTTQSCIIPYDFNGDGAPDLFIGGRAVPWEYGKMPRSYLLQNDGKGHFKDVTAVLAPELLQPAMVTNAIWYDIDNDGDKDLIVATEWDGIYAFINTNGRFVKKILTDKKGWWNFILPIDINNDGKIDLLAGNLGLNSRLKASDKEPVRLYYNDFDDNGKKEQVLTYYVEGREIPFAGKDELQRQIPLLKKNYLYAEDFAKASMTDLFGADKLQRSQVLTANYFANALLINQDNLQFKLEALPWNAQLSPFRDAAITNAGDHQWPDALLVGNYYDNNIQMGRYDADFGTVLFNQGGGQLSAMAINGLAIPGQVRRIRSITIHHRKAFILARNDMDAMVIAYKNESDRK
jgi:hypothetical protein